MELSLIYPMYNEERNVDELLSRTMRVLEDFYGDAGDYEVICVDDGSGDGTLRVLAENWVGREGVRVISLKRHVGHAGAIQAGFRHLGSSTYTVLCNSDLQYLPEEIPKFLRKARANPKLVVVNGWRVHKVDTITKNIVSLVYNLLSRVFFSTRLHDHASNFVLFRTGLVRGLRLGFDGQRFIIASLKKKYRLKKELIVEIPVTHVPRKHGKSNYPVWRKVLLGFFEVIRYWLVLESISRRSSQFTK
ncbi:MAG: glycosyltransferase family 2 protein [Promethearchaeota archaeon]